MSEPRTKAGRRLHRRLTEVDGGDPATEAANITAIEAEARADALDRVEGLIEHAMRQGSWGIEYGDNTFASHVRAILAEHQQDAATDEAEKEWVKPLPKTL